MWLCGYRLTLCVWVVGLGRKLVFIVVSESVNIVRAKTLILPTCGCRWTLTHSHVTHHLRLLGAAACLDAVKLVARLSRELSFVLKLLGVLKEFNQLS